MYFTYFYKKFSYGVRGLSNFGLSCRDLWVPVLSECLDTELSTKLITLLAFLSAPLLKRLALLLLYVLVIGFESLGLLIYLCSITYWLFLSFFSMIFD